MKRKNYQKKTNKDASIILICGAGQLGSRYLQGLAYCQRPLDISVQDISEKSLRIAKERWEQVIDSKSKNLHNVYFISTLDKLPQQIDIAVVATNADVRARVVKQILKNREVCYWVLEKVLAQSENDLDIISELTKNSAGTWVNIPRRMMTWHKQIRENIHSAFPLRTRFSETSWGMAGNGIHLIDLVAWWTGETLKSISNSELNSQWVPAKRKGFYEITGKITAVYSEGTTTSMESSLNEIPLTFDVDTYKNNWKINEQKGVASSSDGVVITGNNEMQSTITARLVEGLLTSGQCDLTKLTDSVNMHRIYLRSLLDNWNKVHNTNVDTLPIT